MNFDNNTISLLSLIVSILSAIIAYKANINSRKANRIAQESMNLQIAPQILLLINWNWIPPK